MAHSDADSHVVATVLFAQIDDNERWAAIVDNLTVAASSSFGETVRQAEVWATARGLVFVCNGLELDAIRNPAIKGATDRPPAIPKAALERERRRHG